jgi:hypothetical protein
MDLSAIRNPSHPDYYGARTITLVMEPEGPIAPYDVKRFTRGTTMGSLKRFLT